MLKYSSIMTIGIIAMACRHGEANLAFQNLAEWYEDPDDIISFTPQKRFYDPTIFFNGDDARLCKFFQLLHPDWPSLAEDMNCT